MQYRNMFFCRINPDYRQYHSHSGQPIAIPNSDSDFDGSKPKPPAAGTRSAAKRIRRASRPLSKRNASGAFCSAPRRGAIFLIMRVRSPGFTGWSLGDRQAMPLRPPRLRGRHVFILFSSATGTRSAAKHGPPSPFLTQPWPRRAAPHFPVAHAVQTRESGV